LKDLKEAVTTVQENPSAFEDGMAPIYGAAGKMPDRGMVQDLLIEYMDINLMKCTVLFDVVSCPYIGNLILHYVASCALCDQ
jgi:hypothetical protein